MNWFLNKRITYLLALRMRTASWFCCFSQLRAVLVGYEMWVDLVLNAQDLVLSLLCRPFGTTVTTVSIVWERSIAIVHCSHVQKCAFDVRHRPHFWAVERLQRPQHYSVVQKKSCIFEFPAFLPPTSLGLTMHSTSALTNICHQT